MGVKVDRGFRGKDSWEHVLSKYHRRTAFANDLVLHLARNLAV
jgi:hypothetical protein